MIEGKKLQISQTGKFEIGDTDLGLHELLQIDPIIIGKEGYMYIYLSNQTPDSDVYFDDLMITHTQSSVIQKDDYYPFGLSIAGLNSSRENSLKNRFLYNDGAEREDAFELNIDFTKFRNYDLALGRWWQVDPLADELELVGLTPYNYSFNNPIRYNDPDGDCPWCVWGAVIGLGVEYTSQVIGNVIESGGEVSIESFTNVDASDLLVAAGVGAATGGLGSLSASFTKTAIAGGIAVVNAMGEGVKATVDVDFKPLEGDANISSTFTGDKPIGEAVVEFVIGNTPVPDVLGKPAGNAVEAIAQTVTGSVQSAMTESVKTVVKEEIE